MIGVMIPSVFAETFDEFEERDRLSYWTGEEYFKEFSSWASDNKDILGKDVLFHVENRGTMKGDFTVSNVSLIPSEYNNHILSFDTTIKLESELRYPNEFVMDGRLLTVSGVTIGKQYLNNFGDPSCSSTGIEFNSESGDTGIFHSCFSLAGSYLDLKNVNWEEYGVAIYVDKVHTGLQPIGVISMADMQNIEEETTSVQQISWFDNIFNFFKSLFD